MYCSFFGFVLCVVCCFDTAPPPAPPSSCPCLTPQHESNTQRTAFLWGETALTPSTDVAWGCGSPRTRPPGTSACRLLLLLHLNPLPWSRKNCISGSAPNSLPSRGLLLHKFSELSLTQDELSEWLGSKRPSGVAQHRNATRPRTSSCHPRGADHPVQWDWCTTRPC